jgi:hypothetical protein
MSTAIDTKPAPQTLTDKCVVDACVQQRLDCCDYRFVFNNVTWHYEADSLTLSGCAPNFYLKQLLQEMMRGIDHVEQVHNNVDVVSSTGLSSESPK